MQEVKINKLMQDAEIEFLQMLNKLRNGENPFYIDRYSNYIHEKFKGTIYMYELMQGFYLGYASKNEDLGRVIHTLKKERDEHAQLINKLRSIV